MDDAPAPVVDPERHRVIDISYAVEPGERPDRPFAVHRGVLHDDTYKYDVLRTHSHVGTHVECGRHFYGRPEDDPGATTVEGSEDNRSIVEHPLESFYSPGVLLAATGPEITAETCEAAIGDVIREGDFVVVRNDSGTALSKEEAYSEGEPPAPTFTESAARWLVDSGVKGLVLGDVHLGATVEESNVFHDVLMSRGVVFVEIVDNLEAISRDRFTVFALPYKARRLGSSFCRAVVIEER